MTLEASNRINDKLRAYWDSLCAGRPFPEERDVDSDVISDIWDHCFLVKNVAAQTEREGFRYDYLGKELIEAFGGDVTNQEISAKLIDAESPPLVKSFMQVVSTGKPTMEDAEFTNSQGLLIKYRSCLLPLGSAKEGVVYILGGMKWKNF